MVHPFDAINRPGYRYTIECENYASRTDMTYEEAQRVQASLERQGRTAIIRSWA